MIRDDPSFEVAPVRRPEELTLIRALFCEYAASLAVDLRLQGFEAELAALPGAYAPPGGEILLACGNDDMALGCIALRPLEDGRICEIKRLYVRPGGRGRGVGAALIARVISLAAERGYREAKLDTLPGMGAARALYRRHGFEPIEPYGSVPYDGLIFLGRYLGS